MNRMHVGTQHSQTVCMWVSVIIRQCYNVLPHVEQCIRVVCVCEYVCVCVCVCKCFVQEW